MQTCNQCQRTCDVAYLDTGKPLCAKCSTNAYLDRLTAAVTMQPEPTPGNGTYQSANFAKGGA